MLKLSLRDLRAHLGRYVLTFVAVMIGVIFMAGILTVTHTISRTFNDVIADVNAGTDAWVQGVQRFDPPGGPGGATERPRIAASYAELLSGVDEIAAAEPWVENFVRIARPDGEPYGDASFGPPQVGGSWFTTEELNPFILTEGSRAPEGPDEVVLVKGTAEGAGYELGDTVLFQSPRGAEAAVLVGIATFGTADRPFGADFILFHQDTAQEVLAQAGEATGIGIVARSGVSEEQARALVEAHLEATVDPETLDNLEVLTGTELTAETQAEADRQFGFVRNILLVFAVLSVAVGAFVIYTSFSFIVAQRQRQVALVRAVGATRRQTLIAVLLESLVVGVLASFVGYGVGLGLARFLSTLLVEDPAALVIRPSSLAISLGAGIVVTVASAFIPAWRASRVPPIAAMRDVAIDTSHRSKSRAMAGSGVLAVGVLAMVQGLAGASFTFLGLGFSSIVLVGIGIFGVFLALVIIGPLAARPATAVMGRPLPLIRGIVGRVAQRNAERNPKRTAYTGSALMIGLGVVSLVLVMHASIAKSIDDMVDNRFVGDYVVDSGMGWTGVGLPNDVARDLNDLDEVAAATGVRFGLAEVDGSTEFVGGLDPATGFDLFDVGVVAGDADDLDAEGIAVFAEQARSKGWEVGDRVPVVFGETGEQTFTVRALLETKDLTGTYLFANEVFDEHLPSSGDNQVWVQLVPGISPGEAEPALEAVIGPIPAAELLDLTEFKAQTKAQLDPILIMFGVLLALTIVVAMVGIVNTLVLSIVERSREIGLTRAIGATRSQVRATIRWEALLIAGFGLVAAIGVGIFFGWIIVQALEEEGFRAFDVPAMSLTWVTLVTGALTLVAAILPAAWGARRPILPAIATE